MAAANFASDIPVDEFRLWPYVRASQCVPRCLSGYTWHELGGWKSSIYRIDHWRVSRRRLHSVGPEGIQQKASCQQQHPCSRMEITSQYSWRGLFLRRVVLVWLDRMDEVNPLDGPNCQRSCNWIWYLRDFLAMLQLLD